MQESGYGVCAVDSRCPAHPELKEFSPHLEFTLAQSAHPDGYCHVLRETVKRRHTALVNCMEKEVQQVQFFKELCVLKVV